MTWTLAEHVRRLARQNTLCHLVFIHPSLAPCKQVWIPESGKYLLVESRIPSSTDTESWIHSVESTIQDCLGLWIQSKIEALFFCGFQASKGKREEISLLTLLFKSWHRCTYLYKPKPIYFKRCLMLVRKRKSQPFLILKRWITWVFWGISKIARFGKNSDKTSDHFLLLNTFFLLLF